MPINNQKEEMMLERTSNPMTVISEGRALVTPLMANTILNATKFIGQRKLQAHHVDKWAMMMVEDRGEFLQYQGISFGRLNGSLYLLNGQHRLNAVVKSGRATGFDFTIYDCANEADLAKYYARFDSEHLSRSLKDIVANDPLVGKDFPPAYLARVCEAVSFIESRFKNVSSRKMSGAARIKERRLEGAHTWEREARQYRGFAKGVPVMAQHRFFSAAPLAVAMVTLRYQPDQASDFWERAIKNDGLRIGDPARALIEAWKRNGVNWTRYQTGHLAAIAWNAAFEEKDLRIIRLSKDGGEMFISGTPY